MRSRTCLGLFAALVLSLCAAPLRAVDAPKPVLTPGGRVVVVGDSITEQKQYSRFIELYLTACLPQYDLHVVQLGWGGERAPGFQGRLENDCLPFKPTVVTLCYGMNDGGYQAYNAGIGKGYGDSMRAIVTRLKKEGVTVVVGTPGAVDTKYFTRIPGPDGPKTYNDNLRQLGEINRALATELGMPFADVHGAMIDGMTKAKAVLGADYDVCGRDGFHPGANGHVLMAYAFLKGMGVDGSLGTLSLDAKAGKATSSDGHKILTATATSVEVESTRYPFCFYGDEKSSSATRSILPFANFQQDLNRLTLVVTNLDKPTAKITWGKASKVYTREQLAQGINLAAEFLDNPFSEPFARLDRAVAEKQNFETSMIKEAITTFPRLAARFTGDKVALDALATLRERLMARYEQYHTGVRTALTPVRHTLTVEPQAE
jgi:lysophospholipase L1-like esterase